MSRLIEARERRNAIARDMRNLIDANPGDKWTPELQAQWDGLDAKLSDSDTELTREQRLLDIAAQTQVDGAMDEAAARAAASAAKTGSPAQALYAKWLRGGDQALNTAEWQAIRNTMSTTTGSEGGFTVQTDVAKSVLDALKAFGGMRSVAEILQTAQGNPMTFPTSNGTAETGEIVAQNATVSASGIVFGTIGLGVYKFSSTEVAIPLELLQDSSVDVEAFVNARLLTRLGRITNTMFTVGTGTNQPQGMVTALSTGKTGATGQTTTVVYDDLVDLIDSVDVAYQMNGTMRFMMHQQTRKALRKLKDTAGRPLWVPSYDGGITRNMPDQLLGHDLVLNNDMPVMAASAKSIAFGDLSYYKIRDVMDVTMYRFTDSAYTKLGQVGFLAFMRSGGAWVDNGGAAKLYVNSAT